MRNWIERMWEFGAWGKFAVLWLPWLVGWLVFDLLIAEWGAAAFMAVCLVFHVWYWNRMLREHERREKPRSWLS